MRLCLVSYELPPSGGGEASYVEGLATTLGGMGHEVTVIAPRDLRSEGSERPFRVVPVGHGRAPIRGAGFLAGADSKVSAMARDRKIDLVHFTFDYPTFPVRLGKAVPSIATVHHLHEVEALSMLPYETSVAQKIFRLLKGSILTTLEGSLVRQCAAVIAVSRFTAGSVETHLSVPRERTHLVRNGIEAMRFARGDPERFRREFPQLGEKTILFVGRLERSKGLRYLISAFARVRSDFSDASLAIVGSGNDEYLSELKLVARSAGVADHVIFTGRISQDLIPHAYAASSLVALPSLMEGFGITLLESMASSRPCVATRVGAIPEIIRNGETGILVRPADSEDLGGKMAALLSDPSLGTAMGKKGLEIVKKEYSVERMTTDTIEVYRRVLDEAHG